MSECCCIDIGDEMYTELACDIRTARKEHICGECGDPIRPGEQYEDFRGVIGGFVGRHKTCAICCAIRRDFFPCGWHFGGMVEDFWDCMGFDYRRVPKE